MRRNDIRYGAYTATIPIFRASILVELHTSRLTYIPAFARLGLQERMKKVENKGNISESKGHKYIE